MEKPKIFGVMAEFATPAEVYHAAEKVRDQGYKKWDVHSPFPIHGIDKAMGLGDSHLGWIALGMAILGVSGGFGLQWWASKWGYTGTTDNAFIIAGKPFNSYPAFFPVTFEPGILFTAFGTVFGMLALNGLPRLYHAVFKSRHFHRASDDRFFITLEARDPKFDLQGARKLLEDAGGKNIETLED